MGFFDNMLSAKSLIPGFAFYDLTDKALDSMGGAGAATKKGGPLNRLRDPAGIFGGNKGMSQDQKMASYLTGGFSNVAGGGQGGFTNDSAVMGPSKNDRDNSINSLGTTPKPIFPGATSPFNPEQGQPEYPGYQSKSIWAGYNPRGI